MVVKVLGCLLPAELNSYLDLHCRVEGPWPDKKPMETVVVSNYIVLNFYIMYYPRFLYGERMV